MVSSTKNRDRQYRIMLMQTMEIATRLKKYDYVKMFGEYSRAVAHKMQTYDYTAEDKRMELYKSLIKP